MSEIPFFAPNPTANRALSGCSPVREEARRRPGHGVALGFETANTGRTGAR